MTKAEIVAQISRQSGIEKTVVMTVIESFMENVKESMVAGNEVFLRGFGSFIIKRRAEKTARNISKNTTIKIPLTISCIQTCQSISECGKREQVEYKSTDGATTP